MRASIPSECGIFLAAALVAFYLVFRGNTYDQRVALWLHIGLAEIALALIAWRFARHVTSMAGKTAAGRAGSLVLLPIAGGVLAECKRPDRKSGQRSALDGCGRRRRAVSFRAIFGADQYGQDHSIELFHGLGCGAETATGIFTSNGKARCTISRRSTISFIEKSIEYMQDKIGTRPSKWCAGCHDHAVFFNGRFDRPIKEQINTPEAQAGLGCMSCHAIVHVGGSMGNGGFHGGVSPTA